MRKVLVICGMLLSMTVVAQPKLSVDKTGLRIGDQVKATITVDLSGGKEWIQTEHIWPDSSKALEVVQGPVWQKDNPAAVSISWMVAVFDTGWVRIPPLPVVLSSGDHTDTLYTNDIPLKVEPVQPDSTGLAQIKDIYHQPFSLGYYKKYIPHLLIGALLIVALIYWLKQRKNKKEPPVPVAIPLQPHEWAEQALRELEEQKLWQRGEVKEHYSGLTGILREYLERRFGIHAREQTSDEILEQLRHQQLSQALLTDTEQLLSVADLIKFAKADPGMDIHAYTIGRVRQFVAETTPAMTLMESETPKPDVDGIVS